MIDASICALLAECRADVEVTGDGPLAIAVRRLVEQSAQPVTNGMRPSLIVETTGTVAAFRPALERVADLGTIVIAGPIPDAPLAIDFYEDVHVRGLTLIGVPPAVT